MVVAWIRILCTVRHMKVVTKKETCKCYCLTYHSTVSPAVLLFLCFTDTANNDSTRTCSQQKLQIYHQHKRQSPGDCSATVV